MTRKASGAKALDAFAHEELAARFRLDACLNRDATSAKYLARDRGSRRYVTVKVSLRPAAGREEADEEFRRSVVLTKATLELPGAVPVIASGWTEHVYWLSTEHHRRPSLRGLLVAVGLGARRTAHGLGAVAAFVFGRCRSLGSLLLRGLRRVAVALALGARKTGQRLGVGGRYALDRSRLLGRLVLRSLRRAALALGRVAQKAGRRFKAWASTAIERGRTFGRLAVRALGRAAVAVGQVARGMGRRLGGMAARASEYGRACWLVARDQGRNAFLGLADLARDMRQRVAEGVGHVLEAARRRRLVGTPPGGPVRTVGAAASPDSDWDLGTNEGQGLEEQERYGEGTGTGVGPAAGDRVPGKPAVEGAGAEGGHGDRAPEVNVAPTLSDFVRAELAERFQVESRVEEGATSASYLARARNSDRQVVVKVQLRASVGDAETEQRLQNALGLVAGLEHRRSAHAAESGWTEHLYWRATERPGRHPVRGLLGAIGPAVATAWERIGAGTAGILDHIRPRRRGVVLDQDAGAGAELAGDEPVGRRAGDAVRPTTEPPAVPRPSAARSQPEEREAPAPAPRSGETPGDVPRARETGGGGVGPGRGEPPHDVGGAPDSGREGGGDLTVVCPSCGTGLISPATHRCQLCHFAPEGSLRSGAALAQELDELAHGELGEVFRLDAPLGHGAASAVYIARGRHTDRQIVVKVLPRPAGQRALRDERFRHAIEQVAALAHPHIVPVFEHGWTEHLYWYSMAHVRGWSLRTFLLSRGRMELKACLRVVAQVASALDHAHRRGVVHGALKPTNVLIDADGWVHIADLLVGRSLEIPAPPAEGAATGEAGAAAEAERPPHAAPEGLWTPAADQFALAMLVSECLEGVPRDETGAAAAPFPPALEQAPRQVRRVVLRGLSRKPVDRFGSVLDFVAALELPADAIPELEPSGVASTVVLKESDWRAPGRPLGRRLAIGAVLALAVSVAFWQRAALGDLAGRLVGRGGAFAFVPLGTDSSLIWDQAVGGAPGQARTRSGRAPRGTADAQPSLPSPRPQGHLFVNAVPWGQLYIDGHLVGNTPKANLAVTQGTHTIRVVREGFVPYEQTVDVAAGAVVRMTTIVLTPAAQQQQP